MALFDINVPTFSTTKTGTGVTLSTSTGEKVASAKRTDTGASSAARIGFWGKAVPGATYTIDMGLFTTPFGQAAASGLHRVGLAVFENATNEGVGVTYNTQNGSARVSSSAYTNLNSSSVVNSDTNIYGGFVPWFFRIVYDGTNYELYYSLDFMETWELLDTLAAATYFTTDADLVGVVLETFSTQPANACRAAVFYYAES